MCAAWLVCTCGRGSFAMLSNLVTYNSSTWTTIVPRKYGPGDLNPWKDRFRSTNLKWKIFFSEFVFAMCSLFNLLRSLTYVFVRFNSSTEKNFSSFWMFAGLFSTKWDCKLVLIYLGVDNHLQITATQQITHPSSNYSNTTDYSSVFSQKKLACGTCWFD